jgi:hypothetical protein
VQHQPKWRARSAGSSTTDPFLFLTHPATKEEVTRPIGRDRAKAAVWKGKGKEDSSSESESFFVVGGIMSILKKLSTSFAKAQMWKQYNKLQDYSITNMDDETLESHREALRLIEKGLQFATQNVAEV